MANKTSVLTKTQVQFLKLLGKNKFLASKFYLSGGAALTEFYIPYRYSEDLDFFSEDEVELDKIVVFLKSCKKTLNYESYSFNTSFNRNLFFLEFPKQNYTLKTEFTYYPFPQIDATGKFLGVSVDSVYDIAVNKLFAIYQKPRSRDFMDLYMIIDKYGYELRDLLSKASAKFDWHIDPLKLGAQFLLAREVKDFPKLLIDLKDKVWIEYFVNLAKYMEGKFTK